MRIIHNVRQRYAIRLKFGGKAVTSLTQLELEAKPSICSTTKDDLLFYCRNFLTFVAVVII